MSDLKNKLIRLGSENPELRPHIRPVLAELNKEAAPEQSAKALLQGFSDNVETLVNRELRSEGVEVRIQPGASVVGGMVNLIYTCPSLSRDWLEINAYDTASPKVIARKLAAQIRERFNL